MVPVAARTPSSYGRLMSRCPSLLGVTAPTGNLTSDYQLLLDRYNFIKTFTDTSLSRYNHQTHVHIDKYSSSNTIQVFYIQVDTSIYIYKFPATLLVLILCNHVTQEIGHVTIRCMIRTTR
jgi:hypothetical protein